MGGGILPEDSISTPAVSQLLGDIEQMGYDVAYIGGIEWGPDYGSPVGREVNRAKSTRPGRSTEWIVLSTDKAKYVTKQKPLYRTNRHP